MLVGVDGDEVSTDSNGTCSVKQRVDGSVAFQLGVVVRKCFDISVHISKKD